MVMSMMRLQFTQSQRNRKPRTSTIELPPNTNHPVVNRPLPSHRPLTSYPLTSHPLTSHPLTSHPLTSYPLNEPSTNESFTKQFTSFKEWPDLSTAPGDDVVRVQAVRIVDSHGGAVENIPTTQSFAVEIEFVVLQGGQCLQPGLVFAAAPGNMLFWSIDTNPELRRTPMEKGQYRSSMAIPADFLAPGTIVIHVGVGTIQISGEFTRHVLATDVLSFNVIDDFSEDSVRCGYQGPIPGFIRPRMKWITAKQERMADMNP